MKKLLLLTGVLFLFTSNLFSQHSIEENLDAALLQIKQLQKENEHRINAAFAAMEAVQRAGAYIESLADLFGNQILSLPVGIKRGDYELIIHRITTDIQTGNPIIHATCAFKFKEDGQRIAFEGQAEISGRGGVGTRGRLSLIAPVERKIGNQSSIIVREGTAVTFGCEGIEMFEAKLTWMLTSDFIVPVDNQGAPTNVPISVAFDASFRSFDNYLVSLNIDRSFKIRGLNDLIFTLRGAVLDQSDTETSSMVQFPQGYFSNPGQDQINLWRGLAVSEASISLPAVFHQPESTNNERITLSLQNVLFDENGFTANVSAENIISSELLDPESWGISLTDFSMGILRNNIYSFGFGGEINIPPFGENSLLPYRATLNPLTKEYEIRAGIAGTYDFPVLSASITLNELSTIDVTFRDSGVFPRIHASGVLNINAPLGGNSANTFSVPGIAFENMIISREAPYLEIGAVGLTGELRSPTLAGFQLSVSDIHTFNNGRGSGLGFTAGIGLNEMFAGKAGLRLYGDYQRWKFREVAVDRVLVDYRSTAFNLAGGVWFKSGDETFGNGFRGDMRLSLINKFDFDAIGVFGKVDNYRYFLTDVFFNMPGSGIPVPPVLSFTGFGGGLYRRMQQSTQPQSSDFGRSLSGINYVPDRNVGMGVMATTTFSLQSSERAFNAKAGFEMQFNSSGGLNFVQFRGDAAFMDTPEKWGNLSDNITANLRKRESGGGIIQPQPATMQELNRMPENKSSGFLTASVNIRYDVINRTFSADLNSFLNAGIITGAGANNQLGWASAFFAPGTWHVHMGTPNNRLGVRALGLAELNGYFMLGDNIPALPLPPQKVLNNLSADSRARLVRSNTANSPAGRGIAFGSAFDVGFEARLFPFYARMAVGLGAEFMLVDLRGRTCLNHPGIPGINGWYAQAQAWAFVEADIGMEARLFGRTRSFSILDLSVAALLQGAGPNPFYFSGTVGGRFSVLGGLISGTCNFNFEIGEKCELSPGGSPFGEDIIAQLTPNAGSSDINVFTAPQAIFNVPVGMQMTIDQEDGTRGTYKVTLEEFRIRYADGRIIAGRQRMSEDGTVSMFTPHEPFESQANIEVYAKVGFQRRVNNVWQSVTDGGGQPVFEEKQISFVSGERPDIILPEHVAYSYPVDRQLNFHIREYNRGYILLTQNYSYLFNEERPEGFNQVLRFTGTSGQKHETAFTHRVNAAGNNIRMEIDFSLDRIPFRNEEIYKLSIVNVPIETNLAITGNIIIETSALETESGSDLARTERHAEEALTQLDEKIIYALHFRTSRFNTFAEKMRTIERQATGWRGLMIEPSVHDIGLNLNPARIDTEFFDAHDVNFVQLTALVEQTDWFTQTFYSEMYRTRALTPLVDRVRIREWGVSARRLLTDDEINKRRAIGFAARGEEWSIIYSLPFWCARDFYAVRRDIAIEAVNRQLTAHEQYLLNRNFPPVVFRGNYPVRVSYVLPGREITTSTVDITVFNPVTP